MCQSLEETTREWQRGEDARERGLSLRQANFNLGLLRGDLRRCEITGKSFVSNECENTGSNILRVWLALNDGRADHAPNIFAMTTFLHMNGKLVGLGFPGAADVVVGVVGELDDVSVDAGH